METFTVGKMKDPELKARWVEALRSGEYEQGQSRLRSENGYCCLGVLADVIDPNAWDSSYSCNGFAWNDCVTSFSNITNDELGIRGSEGVLIGMNDGTGITKKKSSFLEIADWIEEHL